ncbi:MAG: phosphatase PAP2 family protein [Gammaproteobacteria bacterium]|jgi:undecaprenyl-diphosphatase|nr:phosphatase PAP2 family protein [Gammaproteobacteria bacterium]
MTGSRWLLRTMPLLILYAAVIFAGVYAFAELAEEVYEGEGFRFDHILLNFAAEQRHEQLDQFFRQVTLFGSFYLLAPIAIVIIALLLWRRHGSEALLFGVGFGGASLVSITTKYVLARQRPQLFPHLVDATLAPAFPSGHTTQITAFCVAAFLLVRYRVPSWQLFAGVLFVVLILLVALSRIYLQVHYPSDVLAGFVLGLSWVAGIDLLLKLQRLRTDFSR